MAETTCNESEARARLANQIASREELIDQTTEQNCKGYKCKRDECDSSCNVWKDIEMERKMISYELEIWIEME